MSPDDEDTATEVSEGYGGTGPSIGMGTDDTGQISSSASGEGYDDSDYSDYSMLSDSIQMADQRGGTIGKGLSQNEFNHLTGRTATNPYPDSFWSKLVGRENVNYTTQSGGPQGIAELNAIQLDVYNNPIDSKGNLRGSGQDKTAFGNRTEIDREQSTGEMMARGIGALGGLGLPLSLLGKTEDAIKPIAGVQVPGGVQGQGFNYNKTLDPNSPEYRGSQGIIGNLFNTLTGGAGTEAYRTAKSSVKDAISDYFEKEDAAKKNLEAGAGQFGIPDNRTFNPFGNVQNPRAKFQSSRSVPEGYETFISPATGLEKMRKVSSVQPQGIGAISTNQKVADLNLNDVYKYGEQAISKEGASLFNNPNLRFNFGLDKDNNPEGKLTYKTKFFG